MSRKIDLTVRVNADLKDQADRVLESLGLSLSEAVEAFLRQIVSQGRLPFAAKRGSADARTRYENMTHAELTAELEKAYADAAAGRPYDKEAFQALLDYFQGKE